MNLSVEKKELSSWKQDNSGAGIALDNELAITVGQSNEAYAENAFNCDFSIDIRVAIINRCIRSNYDDYYPVLLSLRCLNRWYGIAVDAALIQYIVESYDFTRSLFLDFQILEHDIVGNSLYPSCYRSDLKQALVLYFNAKRNSNHKVCEAFVKFFELQLNCFKSLGHDQDWGGLELTVEKNELLGPELIEFGFEMVNNPENNLSFSMNSLSSVYLLTHLLEEELGREDFISFTINHNDYENRLCLWSAMNAYKSFEFVAKVISQLRNILSITLSLKSGELQCVSLEFLEDLIANQVIEFPLVNSVDLLNEYIELLPNASAQIRREVFYGLGVLTRLNVIDEKLIQEYRLVDIVLPYALNNRCYYQTKAYDLLRLFTDRGCIDDPDIINQLRTLVCLNLYYNGELTCTSFELLESLISNKVIAGPIINNEYLIERYLVLLHDPDLENQRTVVCNSLIWLTKLGVIDKDFIYKSYLDKIAETWCSSSSYCIQNAGFKIIQMLMDAECIDESFVINYKLVEVFIGFNPRLRCGCYEYLIAQWVEQFPNIRYKILKQLVWGIKDYYNKNWVQWDFIEPKHIIKVFDLCVIQGLLQRSLVIEFKLVERLLENMMRNKSNKLTIRLLCNLLRQNLIEESLTEQVRRIVKDALG